MRQLHLCAVIGLLLLSLAGLASSGKKPPRLDRANLLVYRDAGGAERPVKSVADWQKRRASILEAMQQVMGPLPGEAKRCPLDVRVEEETDAGTYVRKKLTYAAEPGGRVPAFLLIPKNASRDRRVPGVLCLHPTNLDAGPAVAAGLGGRDQMHYGAELAERGFAVLAPCYPRMAGYEPDLEALGYASTTMKAIWDNIRGIDLLESLETVRPGGVGAIGHSLGGHNTVYTAVFDERIKVAVSSCGLDSYVAYKDGDIRGWTSKWYMPRLLEYRDRLEQIPFDFHEMVASLAPRHCFINAPLGDDNFKWRSVDEIVRAASQVYSLYEVPDRLRVDHPDCGHDFPENQREAAYRLLEEVLGGSAERPGAATKR